MKGLARTRYVAEQHAADPTEATVARLAIELGLSESDVRRELRAWADAEAAIEMHTRTRELQTALDAPRQTKAERVLEPLIRSMDWFPKGAT